MNSQDTFDALLERYNSGIEPLENWTTADLVKLIDAADSELQNRAPPDSDPSQIYEINQAFPQVEISDDDY